MSRPLGQLEKSLAALTIGLARGQERRAASLLDAHTGEWEQQLRVDVAGQAGNQWGWIDKRVGFDLPFLYAPLQRPLPWGTPQFHHGIEMTQTTATLVIINAHVIEWLLNDSNWCIGAHMRFAVQAPMASAAIPFTASVHLTFQGFGTYAEEE